MRIDACVRPFRDRSRNGYRLEALERRRGQNCLLLSSEQNISFLFCSGTAVSCRRSVLPEAQSDSRSQPRQRHGREYAVYYSRKAEYFLQVLLFEPTVL